MKKLLNLCRKRIQTLRILLALSIITLAVAAPTTHVATAASPDTAITTCRG